MSPDLRGLDKVAARTRKVTPPRRPAPAVTTPADAEDGRTTDEAAPTAATPPADAAPATARAATSPSARRVPRRAPSPAAGARDEALAIPRAAASEQLGVRLHGYQMRRLRRVVRLLDEDESLHRPTQAELIQVLVDALPDDAGPELTDLAGRVRAYRLRIVD